MNKHKLSVGKVVLGLIVVIIVGALVFAGVIALRVRRDAAEALAAARTLQATWEDAPQLSALSSPQLPMELARLRAALVNIRQKAGPALALAPAAAIFPDAGQDIASLPPLLDTTIPLLEAAELGLKTFGSDVGAFFDAGMEALPELLAGITAHPQEVAQMCTSLGEAAARWDAVDISSLSDRVRPYAAQLDALLPAAGQMCPLLPHLPALLGASGERSYLLIAQNNDELRATGGFISGVGLLHLADGQLAGLTFMDSYAVDDLSKAHPSAPPALARYMGAEYLTLRDANWSPDFPTSAQVMAALYEMDQGVHVQGVIAADMSLVETFLRAVGEVRVPDYPRAVTAEDYRAVLAEYWQSPAGVEGMQDPDWWEHRKDFMGQLLGAMLSRALEEPAEVDWFELLTGLAGAAAEKHLLIYVEDAPAQEALHRMGWDGALAPAERDYLLLVDTNVGFNKVNPLIDVGVEYHVQLEGAPTAEVRVTYTHRGTIHLDACIHEARYGDSYADMQERCYWDYLRVYLPAGAEIADIVGVEPDSIEAPAREGDKRVIAGMFVLPPGETHTVTIRYILPAAVQNEDGYALTVQKQAGTEAHPLRVVVEGFRCARGRPTAVPPAQEPAGRFIWESDLRQDRYFRLECR